MNLTPRTADDYLGLITSEHAQREKFVSTVKIFADFFAYLQSLAASFPAAFDVDTAIGVQLDAVGLWVGVSRSVSIPLTDVYFTWDDTDQTGWDSGVWQGPNDPDSGLTQLNDDDYRMLIRARIAANSWDGTIPDAYKVWDEIFPDSLIVIEDHQDMSMSIGIAGEGLSAVGKSLLTGGYLTLKPEGVHVDYYFVTESDKFFAWDLESPIFGGWDEADWAEELK